MSDSEGDILLDGSVPYETLQREVLLSRAARKDLVLQSDARAATFKAKIRGLNETIVELQNTIAVRGG